MEKLKFISRLALKVERVLLYYFSYMAKYRRSGGKTNKILIARTDGMGDYIIWLSVAKEIRSLYPDKKIVMLLDDTKPTYEIAAAEKNIDEIITVGIHGRKRFLSIFRMKRQKYDVIIQPVYSRESYTDLLLFAAKADLRITIDTNGQLMSKTEWKITNAGYDQIIPCSKEVHHELIRCGELIRGLGNKEFKVSYPVLEDLGERQYQGTYILIFPSASWKGKIWEKEKYIELISWILQVWNRDIILCGDVHDRDICQYICRQIKSDRVLDKSGSTTLTETIGLIRYADYVIGNDTGALHIAAACDIPGTVIIADREIGRFFPYEAEAETGHTKLQVIDAGMECRQCLINGIKICRLQENMNDTLPCIKNVSCEMVKDTIQKDRNWVRIIKKNET